MDEFSGLLQDHRLHLNGLKTCCALHNLCSLTVTILPKAYPERSRPRVFSSITGAYVEPFVVFCGIVNSLVVVRAILSGAGKSISCEMHPNGNNPNQEPKMADPNLYCFSRDEEYSRSLNLLLCEESIQRHQCRPC